jgi:hypothetical protein
MCLNPPGLKENPRGTPKWAKHKGLKKIEIRVGSDTITLKLDGRGRGTSSSTLHITEADEDFGAEYQASFNSAIDGLESLVLAHACAGINVEDHRYVAGIAAALEAISNHHT